MLYLKCVLAGIAAALAVFVLMVVALVVVPLLLAMSGTGSGGIGAVSAGLFGPTVLALVSFAGGFYWEYRRLTRARS